MKEQEQEQKPLKLPDTVTKEQMDSWRNRYGKLTIINSEDDGDVYAAVFKNPDIDTISSVNFKMKKDEAAASELLFNSTVLVADSEVKKNAPLRLSITKQLGESLNSYKTKREKY